jgi:protein disulfide-isomerase A6
MKGTAKIAYWDTEQGANPPRLIGQIKGTPTIKLFYPKTKKNKNNKKKIALDYNQAREMAPMKAYVESKIPNFVEKIVDVKQHAAYSDKATRNGLPQVLVFSKSSSTTPLLKYASTEYRRRLLIGEVKQTKKNQELYKKYNIKTAPAMVVVKPDGEVQQYTKGKFSFHKVVNWLGEHALKEAVVPKKKEYTQEELDERTKKKEAKKAKKKVAEEKKKIKSEERKKKKVAEEEKKSAVDGDDLDDDEL